MYSISSLGWPSSLNFCLEKWKVELSSFAHKLTWILEAWNLGSFICFIVFITLWRGWFETVIKGLINAVFSLEEDCKGQEGQVLYLLTVHVASSRLKVVCFVKAGLVPSMSEGRGCVWDVELCFPVALSVVWSYLHFWFLSMQSKYWEKKLLVFKQVDIGYLTVVLTERCAIYLPSSPTKFTTANFRELVI